jgi:hypothetical protein
MAAATLLSTPSDAQAQRRVAVPRPAVVRPSVVVRSPVVVRSRPTVFVGGYYYPSLYRAGLHYGGYSNFGVSFSFGYGPYYAGYYRPYYGYYGPHYGYLGAYYGWPYSYGYPYPYYGAYGYGLIGQVRTQVAPRQTEVFVDGYYAGTVDDFDGTFQRLQIEPGDHAIELYLAGHRPHQQRVYVQPGRTFNIRHAMEPLAPGEPEPARPAGSPLPPAGTRYPPPPTPGPGGATPDPGQGPIARIEPRIAEPGSRSPAPAAQGFGQLSLRVQPVDAEVIIDGEKWEGTLNGERLELQLGTGLHRLEIRKQGYRNYFTDVTILNGQTRTLNVALTRN